MGTKYPYQPARSIHMDIMHTLASSSMHSSTILAGIILLLQQLCICIVWILGVICIRCMKNCARVGTAHIRGYQSSTYQLDLPVLEIRIICVPNSEGNPENVSSMSIMPFMLYIRSAGVLNFIEIFSDMNVYNFFILGFLLHMGV